MGREIKRVALDFDWPTGKIWGGFLRPEKFTEKSCPDCEIGYNPEADELYKKWYGNTHFDPSESGSEPFTADTPELREYAARKIVGSEWYYGSGPDAAHKEAQRLADLYNGMWMHHLSQEDVDALVAAGRLMDFTHSWTPETRWQPIEPAPVITAEQVNIWAISGLGHDSINCSVVLGARLERQGKSALCPTCNGHASVEAYPGQREEAEKWKPTEPPTGEGWQVWETVSEGSPISPVFADREDIIRWLMSPAYHWGISTPLTREQAENFTESAWAPSMVVTSEGVFPGEQKA